MNSIHVPVLTKEVLQYLNPKPNENFIDATLGLAGHSKEILKRNGPQGKVLGIEWDPRLYWEVKSENVPRLILENNSFSHLKEIAVNRKFGPINGILFDLGISSWHLEKSGRGFSFQREEPLDMRFSPSQSLTAEKIINQFSKKEIASILKELGEERFAQRISQKIVEKREQKPIKTTSELTAVIKEAVPLKFQSRKFQHKHFATRTFQALRIAVNGELSRLKPALEQAITALEKEGRLVVISFHSLEDRIVKHFFKEKAKQGIIEISTKKPLAPDQAEVNFNPRARSAKLRACFKR